MKRSKPLVTRLRSARILLREWRVAVWGRGPVNVESLGAGQQAELARFRAADVAIAEAIKAEEARQAQEAVLLANVKWPGRRAGG